MLQDFSSDKVPSRDLHDTHKKYLYINKQKLNRIAQKRKKERSENKERSSRRNELSS